ncbi:MAG: heterocyst frequency control protein PatD [Coleofasciculaceae cyanobacterium]
MLPLTHQEPYKKFKQILEQILESRVDIDLEKTRLPETLQNLQEIFKSEIATLSADDLDSEYAGRWQSVQTEFLRQMRLLETDVMLLQAARRQATLETRIAGICDRIKTLIQYCQVLLQ